MCIFLFLQYAVVEVVIITPEFYFDLHGLIQGLDLSEAQIFKQ